MTAAPEYIRCPSGETEVEPRSGLTGADIRELVRLREVKAVPVRLRGERYLIVSWDSLRDWIRRQDRQASYNVPRAFEYLLARHPNRHVGEARPDLQLVAGPFVSGEEQAAERTIAEQESARRAVVVLYSRKSVWIAFVRKTFTKH